jgi:hypothetical protein
MEASISFSSSGLVQAKGEMDIRNCFLLIRNPK